METDSSTSVLGSALMMVLYNTVHFLEFDNKRFLICESSTAH